VTKFTIRSSLHADFFITDFLSKDKQPKASNTSAVSDEKLNY
jgi:hypothetical protein